MTITIPPIADFFSFAGRLIRPAIGILLVISSFLIVTLLAEIILDGRKHPAPAPAPDFTIVAEPSTSEAPTPIEHVCPAPAPHVCPVVRPQPAKPFAVACPYCRNLFNVQPPSTGQVGDVGQEPPQ